jgi:hypothetical protein
MMMAIVRTPIPEDASAEVLFRHDHTCCICQERGKYVQIHHIDDDPSNNDLSNLAVLCLQCHNDTQIKGGFGRKRSATEVKKFRDDWVKRVTERWRQADEILVQKQVGLDNIEVNTIETWEPPSDMALIAYVRSIPDIVRTAYELARPEWDTHATNSMAQATYQVIDVVRIWVQLAAWFPPNHFGNKPAPHYLNDLVASRFELRYALMEPEGPRTRGTMIRPMVAYGVLLDLQEVLILSKRFSDPTL